MKNTYTNEMPSSDIADNKNLGAIDILIMLAKHKKVIFGVPILFAICAALISLLLPNIYKANAKILPPQQAQSGAAAILAQLGGVAGAAGGASGIKNPNDLYIGMLKSRSVLDKVVNRFDLKHIYGVRLSEQARDILEGSTIIVSGKDGLIDIEVEDIDPKRAAILANGYVDELLNLTKGLALTEAAQRRVFFEGQWEIAKNNLANAEVSLKHELDAGGVISVDAQSRAIAETDAHLRAQIAAKEIQLSSMSKFVTSHNPDYLKIEQELGSMKFELAKQENGLQAVDKPDENSKSMTGLNSIKILRDVKYYQMIYELLAKQYEIARLDESKDSSIIQILDKAVEPERKYKPRRLIIVFSFGLLGCFFAIFYALFIEGIKKNNNPLFNEKLAELKVQFLRRKRS